MSAYLINNSDERGFSLVETVVSALIVLVVFLGVAQVLIASNKEMGLSQDLQNVQTAGMKSSGAQVSADVDLVVTGAPVSATESVKIVGLTVSGVPADVSGIGWWKS